MNGIFSYLKSYVILFLVLTILLEMVPKAGMQKYIRFFSQMILAFGLLYPVLGWMGESDAFLEKIEYQSFLQKMEEVQTDAEKITYLGNDHYVKKYEDAIALDVTQMAQEENFAVKEIAVEMTENYEIKCIRMTLANPVKEGIVIGKVVLEDGQKKQASEDSAYKKLKEKLVSYYQLSEEQLDILYELTAATQKK